jgi:hypothetical protein
VVEVELDGGGSVFVEVPDDEPSSGMVGGAGRILDTAHPVRGVTETLQEALGRIRPALEAVVGQVRGLASPPDRVSIEFGIKVTAEAGVVIAKAATEANFTVSAEWTREGVPPLPGPRPATRDS